MSFISKWLQKLRNRLIHNQDTPASVAFGFSIGIFLGFSPLWGVKTLLSMGLAKLLRTSVIAAVVGVTLHEFIIPLTPLLIRWEYDLGYWLLSNPHHFPTHVHLGTHAERWFKWSTYLSSGKPLLLGSLTIGMPAAILAYWIAKPLIIRWRKKHPRPVKDGEQIEDATTI